MRSRVRRMTVNPRGFWRLCFSWFLIPYCLVKDLYDVKSPHWGVIDIQRLYLFIWIQLDEFGDNYTSVVLSGAENGARRRVKKESLPNSLSAKKKLNLCQWEHSWKQEGAMSSQACHRGSGREGLARCHPAQLWLVSYTIMCQHAADKRYSLKLQPHLGYICINSSQINKSKHSQHSKSKKKKEYVIKAGPSKY